MKLVTLALLLSAASAAADNPDPTALEASGSKHCELAEYPAAIADFKEAFRLGDRPELLFNIAQAYRLAGDCVQARTFYKTYLRRVPDAPNADKVRVRIDEPCAEPAPTDVGIPGPPTNPTPVPRQPPPPVVTHGRTWRTKAGFAAIGGGALGLGLGVVFAARGSSKASELRDACAIECTSETARSLDDAGAAANRHAVIGLVAGGALVATGVVLVILDRPSRETGPSISIGANGASAAWRWTF